MTPENKSIYESERDEAAVQHPIDKQVVKHYMNDAALDFCYGADWAHKHCSKVIAEKDAELEKFKKYSCDSCFGVGEVGIPMQDGSYENRECVCIENIKQPLRDKIAALEKQVQDLELDNDGLRDDKDASANRFNKDQERIEDRDTIIEKLASSLKRAEGILCFRKLDCQVQFIHDVLSELKEWRKNEFY